MFDVIGRRRWFYLFSALLTIPGLIFILLTFVSNGQAGLRFSIDYTGGTVWPARFHGRLNQGWFDPDSNGAHRPAVAATVAKPQPQPEYFGFAERFGFAQRVDQSEPVTFAFAER